MSNIVSYKDLRKKYPEFVYDSYSWRLDGNELNLNFTYKVGGFEFKHKIIIENLAKSSINKINDQLKSLIFNIGMVEIFNYWKTFCSPKIIIKAGFLDNYQIKWWKKLLINGMGQYFYENKIDFTSKNFVTFKTTGIPLKVEPLKVSGREVLVPIGGGKDSAVTLELISQNFKNTLGLIVNKTKARTDTAKVSGIKTVVVKRILDKSMIALNKREYLNGHIPFTTVLSFISLLIAYLNNKKYIAFSNEQSSNEGNVVYKGLGINHQYSKSFELENDFREYNFKYLSNINYFSFLRPIYDIQIAKMFSNLDNYFSIIRSCNVGQKNDSWCGKCPKCLSTFILLYPFIMEKVIKIFGNTSFSTGLLPYIGVYQSIFAFKI